METDQAPIQPSESEMLIELREEEVKERWRRRHPVRALVTLVAGVLSGVTGGIGMALVLLWRAWANGLNVWTPMHLIAASFYGEAALQGDPKAVVAGVMLHLGVSVLYGILFSLCVSRATPLGIALLYGMVYSVLIWAGMTYFALPLVDPLMQEREVLQSSWWFGAHLVFGALLFVTPILKNALAATDVYRSGRS